MWSSEEKVKNCGVQHMRSQGVHWMHVHAQGGEEKKNFGGGDIYKGKL